MVDTTPRTTTRKPRTRAAVSSEVQKPAVKRVVRRKAAPVEAAPRKAPTTIAAPRRKNPTLLYVGLAFFVLMFGTSAVIGFTADGQINVGGAIISQGGGHYTAPDGTEVAMPPQQNQQPINSGLVPSSEQPANLPPPAIETASSTEVASGTEVTASSTESVAEEGVVAGEATTTETGSEQSQ